MGRTELCIVSAVVTLCGAVLLGTDKAQAAEPEMPAEISVSAEAHYFSPPDTVRLIVLIEATGQTAADAVQALETGTTKVKDTLKTSGVTATLTVLRQNLFNAAQKGSPISTASAVKAQRVAAIEAQDLDKAGRIIDQLLRSGAAAVSEVQYVAAPESKSHLEAVRKATEDAKAKAALVAGSFGVKLGRLLSAGITEEPPLPVVREGMERMSELPHGAERDLAVSVTVRFEITR